MTVTNQPAESNGLEQDRLGLRSRNEEAETLIVSAMLHRPDLLNGQAARVPGLIGDPIGHALAWEVNLARAAGREPNPNLIVAAVAERFGPEPVGEYMDRMYYNWPPDQLLSGWPEDAIRALAEVDRTHKLARALKAARHRLRDRVENGRKVRGATAADLLPDLEQAIEEARRFDSRIKEKGSLRESEPVPMSKLGDAVPPDWLWPGYLAVGHITLLCGLWKAGKTTLLTYLLGGFCGRDTITPGVKPAKVLVISEEPQGMWAERRDRVGMSDGVAIWTRPFMARPTAEQWHTWIDELADLIRRDGYTLVVFDPISACWPLEDENDAAGMLAALRPLHQLCEAGAAVLLIHHPRKSEGSEGQAARGSGALPGFVDIIVELRRHTPLDREDPRRVLTAYSRLQDTPPEMVMELKDGSYHAVGTRRDSARVDRQNVILDHLLTDTPQTAEELLAAWPDGGSPKPSKRALEGDLAHGATQGVWQRTGKGKKTDPYKFAQASFHNHARIESEPGWNGSTSDSQLGPLGGSAADDGTWSDAGGGADQMLQPGALATIGATRDPSSAPEVAP